jgi:polygalacturonase
MIIRAMLASVALLASAGVADAATREVHDIRDFGARPNDGVLDTDAINKAIDAASAAGGGVVYIPPGRYLSFSIHLKSHIAIVFAPGSVIEAADPAVHPGKYDNPEPNENDIYQDYGHSHWQNSLIWGDGVEDVSITGPGLIDGKGLTRGGPGSRWQRRGPAGGGGGPLSMANTANVDLDAPLPPATIGTVDITTQNGRGNKAIALKNARHITMRDFSILQGGHFAIIATGVDDMTIDNIRIDTNRDGIDLDVVRNVRVSNVSINAPNDDALVLKSSVGLGEVRPTENVVITNCHVSGYDMGTMLSGTFGRTMERAPDRDGPTGRIKLGTEGSGGFRNITVSNCTFDRSRGLAIESVDGAVLENITVTNLVMRDVTTAPIFIRLGQRDRTPAEGVTAKVRNIVISNIVATGIDHRYAATISGTPGHPVENVTLSNIRLVYKGGGTAADAARKIPEVTGAYPEPSMFGVSPAYGLFARHVKGLVLRDIDITTETPDARPKVVFTDVSDVRADPGFVPPARPARK